ncbi:hypothetical protein N7523_008421 [Penicillium sp. IBT 18751x]|nr:hypothetical protein N7523_008421 [Penicillium sp. IBT 18751x]
MSSRFPPSSGFNSRDRSPPRFGDRRAPVGPRGPDDGSPSFDREPPRGPRALVDSPRGGFGGGRGRGYGRGDFRDRDRDRDRDMRDRDRDRDFRDNRDAPPYRRDMDRDWGRRDRNFDPRDAPRMGFGRGRSRSPTRDFRDLRDPPGRDFDLVRMRRNSRDSLLSASSGGPDGPPSSGGHPRGGSLRGRGRGDWEGGRGRGRPTYMDDREPPFRRRSRSRDVWRDRGRDRLADREREREMDRDRLLDRERERDIRERDRDRDQERRERFDRRDDWDPRRPDRDDRERPLEPWKRERPPSRASSRGPISLINPSNPNTMPLPTGPPTHDRMPDVPFLDQARKASIVSGPAGIETRRDSERSEPAPLRLEAPKDLEPISQHSPPPSAPQVPAFGSVSAPILPLPTDKGPSEGRPSNESFPQIEKDRSDGPRRPSLQPPTGPRAERVERSPDPVLYSSDGGHQQDERSRTAQLPTHVSDRSPPTAPAAMVKRDSISSYGEVQRLTKPTSTNMSPNFARLPPPGPRASSRETSISPRMQSSTIPTGPRAYHPRPAASPRGPNKAHKPWAHPIPSRAPSVSSLPPKRDAEEYNGLLPVDEKPRQIHRPCSPLRGHEKETDTIATDDAENPTSPSSPSMKLPIRTSPAPVPVSTVEASKKGESEQGENEDSAPVPGFGQFDEEEEENVVFNQEYLEERKQIFERDMQLLRAEMPPPPLEDPVIVSLLLQIQLLGMLAHEEEQQPPSRQPPVSLPLPSVEQEETSHVPGNEPVVTFDPYLKPEQHEPEAQTEAVVRTADLDPQITIKSLPFLNSGPPTPLSDLEVYRENVSIQERLKNTLCSELSKKQKAIAKKNAVLRDEYMSYYKPWRLAIWELDRFKDKKPMTPGPASPPAPPAPVSPAPTQEGRESRRYKGNSELDFLNALRASEISAQEELERRRTKMATARPDLSREAIIPDMLEREEEIARIYKDVNNIVEARHALDVFGFIPPRNDFTEKEHEIFTNAFMAHPKKWGKIAESLPGRTFKQCIIHYYLTKEEIKYKAKLNKRWSRRGRGKQKSTRPKSNALIADLGVVKPDFDGEEEPAPVTDTGRPRRAAAPTFGDYNEPEGSVSGRRGQISKDGELIEKPASRRGGRTAGGTRGQRRGKTTQPDQKSQGTTPQSTTPVAVMPQMDISADGIVESIVPQDRELIEKELNPQIPRPRTVRGRAKEGMYVFDTTEADTIMPAKSMETGYGGMQPTSYWSVPEQRDFPRLLAHFGRDFEGISNFMKTKTTVMVKNYYQRRLDSGQKDFEETLLIAEDKKARGEPTGALPVPTSAPKRRYEATPSAIVPRPLAPHGELMTEADEARFSSKGKPLAMSPQPMSLHARPISDSERGSSRYPALAQASNASQVSSVTSTLSEDASRAMRNQPGPAHRIQGPRLGYFTEDRRDSLMGHSNPRAPDMQILSRQNPGAPIPSDLARMDPLSAQGYMSTQPPPSLLPSSHSRHPSLTQAPGSPTPLARPELDFSSVHRDPFGQRQYYQLPGQPVGLAQSPRPVLSPVKDAPRPSVTPIPEPTSRQVPAKRSNIMSILNDEPEDPQPRKRVASEQTTSAPVSSSSISRSAYQNAGSTRPDEALIKPSSYSQQSQYATPSRGYPEYSNYGPPPGGSGTPANNDWMARFDPRAQQAGPPSQSQPPPPSGRASTSMASQSSFSPYTSGPTQPSGSLGSIPAPSPAPTPPPASQRSSYPHVFSQATPAPSGSREIPSQSSVYRPSSPPSRSSSVAFGSRQEQSTPAQSSSSLFGLTPRQPASQSSYASVASSTPASSQAHNQSYQQHVQTLVSGSHQSHRTTPVGLTGGPPQYGHSTPPPQAQGGRSMPSLATLGRSYTPPAAMHPPGSGMGYAPPPPATSGPIPPLQRPSGQGSLGEPPNAPTHHRVYSQGSSQSGMPGPLHPASQPPR